MAEFSLYFFGGPSRFNAQPPSKMMPAVPAIKYASTSSRLTNSLSMAAQNDDGQNLFRRQRVQREIER